MSRHQVIQELARRISAVELDHPLRIGIDGVDCSGKTTLAKELVVSLRSMKRMVIRASIDGFHNPAGIRRRQGVLSPRGYFEDSFDLKAVQDCLLLPLGPGGSRRYQIARFDFKKEEPVHAPWLLAADDAILIFEGVFLHRPELRAHWDFTVFVQSDFSSTLERAVVRDRDLFGSEEEIRRRYEERYIPGQRLYLESCRPEKRANAVFLNDDFERPELRIRESTERPVERPRLRSEPDQ